VASLRPESGAKTQILLLHRKKKAEESNINTHTANAYKPVARTRVSPSASTKNDPHLAFIQ
jgi:hypothetical protein